MLARALRQQKDQRQYQPCENRGRHRPAEVEALTCHTVGRTAATWRGSW